jgi:hypothetical protein
MNPFILCPGGPNGSSVAQIELEKAKLERREERQCAGEREVLARMVADGAGVSAEERCIFGALSRAPGERQLMHLGRKSSWKPASYCWAPLSFDPASGGVKG